MAIAEIELPDGRIAEIEIPDDMPTEQAQEEIQAMYERGDFDASPQAQPQEVGMGDRLVGGLESAATIGSSILAEPVSGIVGIGQTLNPFAEEGAGARAVEATREALTYQPRTERGQQVLGKIGETLAPAGEALESLEGQFGETALQATGSPTIAAGAASVPTALMETIGLGLGRRVLKSGDAAQDAANVFSKQSKAKQRIAEQILENPSDKRVVESMVRGAGEVRSDKLAQNVIKQGFDDGVVAVAKGATPRDKAKMRGMLQILKKAREDSKFAAQNRPADIAGQSMAERINHITKVNREAGKRVDEAAKALKGQEVDFTPAIDNFNAALADMGITLKETKKGVKPVFKGSTLEGLKGPQLAIKNMVSRMNTGTTPDAFDVHMLKKYIDENVSFGKTKEGLSGKTERVLKGLRRDLDGVLDDAFPAYREANEEFAMTRGALDSFQDAAGRKVDLANRKAVGTSLRRLLSNTQSRANMMDAIEEVEKVAKATGGDFADDITTQVLFADELDSMFGPAARTSLAGETRKAVESASRGREGLFGMAVERVGEGVEKLRGINEENAIKAMEELLKRGAE